MTHPHLCAFIPNVHQPEPAENNMEGKRVVFNVAFIVNLLQFVFIFIAFSSPYWFQSWPRVYSPFKRIGLWEACFAGLVLEVDPRQKAYHGCWWILSPEYHDIRDWLMPHWFIVCQLLTTLTFVGSVVNLILMLYIWVVTDSDSRSGSGKRSAPICAVQTSTFITIASAFCMIAVCMIFGLMSYYDYYWMPNPDLNYLSWSYGMAVLGMFMSVFAGIALVVYTKLVRQEMRQPRTPMMVTHPVKDSSL